MGDMGGRSSEGSGGLFKSVSGASMSRSPKPGDPPENADVESRPLPSPLAEEDLVVSGKL